MKKRIKDWTAHNDLQKSRPMILIELEGLGPELNGYKTLNCNGEYAREIELLLLNKILTYKLVNDDSVVDSNIYVNWDVSGTDYGIQLKMKCSDDPDGRNIGYHYDPAIDDLEKDFDRLRKRTFWVDRDITTKKIEHLNEVFNGILNVEAGGAFWWTYGMTWTAISLIGLENLMLYMYDAPETLHRLSRFFMMHQKHCIG
jgi:hypothetical protein